jgi:hypothetical protein
MQDDRQMSAYNLPMEGMANTRESAILSAAVEAVTWKHALEIDGSRQGQRIVICPKELTQLEAVLNAGDPSIDSEDGHHIAYTAILRASQTFEKPPVFMREDSSLIAENEEWSESVPRWMNTA